MSGSPDIQIEAIFRGLHAQWRGVTRKRNLHAVRAVVRRLTHSLPLSRGLWRPPPQLADRRQREWDALEGANIAVHVALEFAGIDGNRGRRRCRGRDRRRASSQQTEQQRGASAPEVFIHRFYLTCTEKDRNLSTTRTRQAVVRALLAATPGNYAIFNLI